MFARLLFTGFIALVVTIASTPIVVSAQIDEKQQRVFNRNVDDFDVADCNLGASSEASSEPVAAGKGGPRGIVFPDLDPSAMAEAIDEFIQDKKPNSKMRGVGAKLVATAENSNISPFLVVALAQKESSLADPSDYNVRNGNNAFGRTATTSQPNFQGARLWYKWTSVEASVDHTAAENKRDSGDIAAYLRSVYKNEFDKGDLTALMNRYAPPSENNTALYIKNIKSSISEMVRLTGDAGGGDVSAPEDEEATSSGQPSGCACQAEAEGTTQLSGSGNNAKAFNFLVDKGFTPNQAAGAVGSMMQESGGGGEISTTALNPSSGAYGIAQWLGGRKSALQAKKDFDKIDTQLEHVWSELKGSEGAAYTKMKATKTLAEATTVWTLDYERPGVNERVLPKRIGFARAVLGGNEGAAIAAEAGEEEPSTCSEDSAEEGTGDSTGDFQWPIEKRSGILFSCYGYARGRLHTGIDIAAAVGTKIMAADGGVVVDAGNLDPDGFGNTVIIKHGSGKWTLYAHLSKITVEKGKKVSAGQQIGKSGGAVGSTGAGSSQGPHLHFNIQTSGGAGQDSVDPLKYLPKDGRQVNPSGGDCPSSF